MNASVTALVFVGLLLTVLGLLVASNRSIVALGIGALVVGGILEVIPARRS